MTLGDLLIAVVILSAAGLLALGLWILLSRICWGLCVVLAMMTRMAEEKEISSDDFLSIAEQYYDRIPLVQK